MKRALVTTEELSEPQKVVADRLATDWSVDGLARELTRLPDMVALVPTARGIRKVAFEPDELGLSGFYTLDGQPFPSLEGIFAAVGS
jgi:hypothetical protein